MCGIAGGISLKKEITDDFSKHNRFRGPDYFGKKEFSFENLFISFHHHRLSIVDLSEDGNQPMESENFTIVFNGEIYNFQKLKAELSKKGVEFKTNSDTEVILQCFENYPAKEAIAKLDGMFAFAIFNKNLGKVILVRDRWGKKPLYYYQDETRFLFSSDIRSFKELDLKLTIDYTSLNYFFSELAVPQPRSIFNEIKQVQQGEFLEISNLKFESNFYHNLNDSKKTNASSNHINNIEQLLENAVAKRLIADVPIGSFLSGGIDSGLMVALASKHYNNFNTYTIGFGEKQFDERPFAELVSKKYKTNHHELLVKADDIDLEKLVMEFGEPFADSSMIPSFLISKEVSKTRKVVLSGDGGDELFMGNETYVQAYKFDQLRAKTKFLKLLPKKLGALNNKVDKLLSLQHNPQFFCSREMMRSMSFTDPELQELLPNSKFNTQKFLYDYLGERIDGFNNLFQSVIKSGLNTRLINDYLVKVDRSSMYSSLEVRSPFMDDDLLNYVLKLNKEQIMPGMVKKGLLKEMAKKHLPKEILTKPKTGFAIPLDLWLRSKWKSMFEEKVLSTQQTLIPFNYDFVKKLWEKHKKGESHGNKLFSILVIHIWIENFFNPNKQ